MQNKMRRNWTKQEDSVLRRIITSMPTPDWVAVANELRSNHPDINRTGKQCRERWRNHLDPLINKRTWGYQEEAKLFEQQRLLGNRWKQMTVSFEGRTDNNIKNQFYSTLRRSLRRLNKIIGEKNSTLQMREIKPSVLTIILNYIYDNNEGKTQEQFLSELKDLPKLIFEFASFKPVKENMKSGINKSQKQKIETIFRLVQQFKESYYQEKCDKQEAPKKRRPKQHEELDNHSQSLLGSYRNEVNQFSFVEQEQVLSSNSKPFRDSIDRNGTTQKSYPIEFPYQMMEMDELTPINCFEENLFPELIVIGKPWQPRQEDLEREAAGIDEVLEMNYDLAKSD